MAFKQKGWSAFTQRIDDKKYTDEQVSNALEDWKKAEMNSEEYRDNQLNSGGNKERFNKLDSITNSKRNIYENLLKNSNFKPNKKRE